ncbi:hypothetical protein [Mesorhizobium sp. M0006]|uniref:hypothetical protein n=1 Tax=Mesorhizobium sp. M0006 TaxID=2956838 RepID=UPI00333C53A1
MLTAYSADPIAIGATLLTMIGRNGDSGSGSAADFAESVERMRDRMRLIVQRGRLHRRSGMPKVTGVLDQFIVEQLYDEDRESWHPKLALIGYEGPAGEHIWRFWIGSRNLTPSRDLDLGLLIEGTTRRLKGARPIPDLAIIGERLASLASLEGFPASMLREELRGMLWRAPDDVQIDAVQLRMAGDLPASPLPVGSLTRIVAISPFLCPKFVKTMTRWGDATTERVMLTTVPAVRSLPLEAKAMLKPVRLLALAPPEPEPDIVGPVADAGRPLLTPAATDAEAEPSPLSLHAKLFAFWSKESVKIVMGSANATDRAWSGRNAEATVTFGAGPSILTGIDAILGSAMPIPAEILAEPAPSTNNDPAELLDNCRRRLVVHWPLAIARTGERFTIAAKEPPSLGKGGIRLEAGLVTGTTLPWPNAGLTLDLGEIPLAWQTDLVQLRLILGDVSCGWMQRVAVTPPIEQGRDRAAIARFLGIRSFYAWMRGLLDGEAGAPDGDPWERHHRDHESNDRDALGLDDLTLEDILTAWARDKAAFQRADARFETYLTAILAHDDTLTSDDRRALNALRSIWTAARIALMSAA